MASISNRARRVLRRNAVQAAQREEVRTLAVGYLRVSTEEQALKGHGLDAQEEAVRAYAKAVGLDLVDVITDAGVSGASKPAERPGFGRVMQMAAERRFSVLLLNKFDRLARHIAFAVTTSAELDKEHGVTIRSVQEGVDLGSSAGKMIFGLLAALAEGERDAITLRTKGGRMQKAGKGGFAGGRIPYGYVSDGKGGLAIDEDRRGVVERIFEENGQGRTLRAIADGLNRDGIPSPKGGLWSHATVGYVLNNQVYEGKIEVVFITAGTVTHVNRAGDHARLLRRPSKGKFDA